METRPSVAVRMRVLTVGDGDLSYSLALVRAYGDRIRLTATVLPTAEELVATPSEVGLIAVQAALSVLAVMFLVPTRRGPFQRRIIAVP